MTSQSRIRGLPYRGRFGDPRPGSLRALPLPPAPMPSRLGLRPLKAWRYVGVFADELMLCAAQVRVGPVRQSFWALWDRRSQTLSEHTALGGGSVRLEAGRLRILDWGLDVDLRHTEDHGVETICAQGAGYGWTRKQGGVPVRGRVTIAGVPRSLSAWAVIDDTAAYFPRHTFWRWCAGVGALADGRPVAWNLVAGVNDPLERSERTVWIDGLPHEVGPARFSPDLSFVECDDGLQLRFTAEATRERSENRLLVRSRYRQPFGTFSGALGPGLELSQGRGVMEEHDAFW